MSEPNYSREECETLANMVNSNYCAKCRDELKAAGLVWSDYYKNFVTPDQIAVQDLRPRKRRRNRAEGRAQ